MSVILMVILIFILWPGKCQCSASLCKHFESDHLLYVCSKSILVFYFLIHQISCDCPLCFSSESLCGNLTVTLEEWGDGLMAMPMGLSTGCLLSRMSSGIRPMKPQQAQQLLLPPLLHLLRAPIRTVIIHSVYVRTYMFHKCTHDGCFCPLI